MPEIKLSTTLLFLIPGLLAYCALYGIFSRRTQSIAPPPPPANSIKTITIVLVASVIVHGLTALLIGLNGQLCSTFCCLPVREGWDDPYRLGGRLTRTTDPATLDVGYVIAAALLQGFVAYRAIRSWLRAQARKNRLPDWLYGWSASIANQLDDVGKVLIAYVLTTIDVSNNTVLYCGAVRDVELGPEGGVARIVLDDCERYIVDLTRPWPPRPEPEALAVFASMTIEAATIRNIAFETLPLGPVIDAESPPSPSEDPPPDSPPSSPPDRAHRSPPDGSPSDSPPRR